MYAIVDVAGQQFKVEAKQKVYVHRLQANEGDNIEFKNVKLLDNNGKITIGTPNIDGARVAATVLAHLRGDKVLVHHKKRRKGYAKTNGHRQDLTQIFISGIAGKGEDLKLEKAPVVKAKTVTTNAKSTTVEVKPKKVAVKKAAAPKAPKAEKKATTTKRAPKKKA